jgi:hypothetical protein
VRFAAQERRNFLSLGIAVVVSEKNKKYESQRRLVTDMDPQWLPQFDALRQEYVDMMLEGIVNFEIPLNARSLLLPAST